MNLIPEDLEARFAAALEARQTLLAGGLPKPSAARAAYFRDRAAGETALAALYAEAHRSVSSMLLRRALVTVELTATDKAAEATEKAAHYELVARTEGRTP